MSHVSVTVTDGEDFCKEYSAASSAPLLNLRSCVVLDIEGQLQNARNYVLLKDMQPLDMDMSAEDAGIQTGDLLVIGKMSDAGPGVAASPVQPAAAPPAQADIDVANFEALRARVSSIVKSLPKPIPKASTSYHEYETSIRDLFDRLPTNPQLLQRLETETPIIAQAFKDCPTNYEYFRSAFMRQLSEMAHVRELMSDPTSVEGQMMLAEQIRRKNIDESYALALEHNPEAFASVDMLYISLRINGVEAKAFIDSGAQISIMSAHCAQRAHIEHMIDDRLTHVASGIGGVQKSIGRIHSCTIQIDASFFECPFTVMPDRSMDLLIGLDILRRHHCEINLRDNLLIFGDGTRAPFLSSGEIRNYLAEHGIMNEEIEPNPDFVQMLVTSGCREEEARVLLKRTLNDLDAALRLFFQNFQGAPKQPDMK